MIAPASAPLTIGRVFAGRYEIVDVIGDGTTGTVYLARDRASEDKQTRVAVKVIHQSLSADRQVVGRFHREAAILKRIQGRHVTELRDFIEEDGLLLIVLEYVEGPSLDQVLSRRHPLGLDEALRVAIDVCRALQSVHDGGIIHRDLKPANVLLDGIDSLSEENGGWDPRALGGPLARDGVEAKVVDFGLAKVLHGEQTGTALTEQDMIFGTPDYMSPEQVLGDDLDPRCDIYAVGVVLYEMLVGDVPFTASTPLGVMSAHVKKPVPKPKRDPAAGKIPAALERVVLTALAKDRDERFASADELAAALQEVDLSVDEEQRGSDADESSDSTLVDADTGDIALGSTLQSYRDSDVAALAGRGARVEVRVQDADPVSGETRGSSRPPAATLSDRPESSSALREGIGERRFWLIAAVVAAVAAVALGVLCGVR